MSAADIKKLCGKAALEGHEEERNLAAYFSVLAYLEKLERIRGKTAFRLKQAEGESERHFLARTWKNLYNPGGSGSVKGFEKRFRRYVRRQLGTELGVLQRRIAANYDKAYAEVQKDKEITRRAFFISRGYFQDISEDTEILLEDKFGIDGTNIYTKIEPWKPLKGPIKGWYAHFKQDRRVNLVIRKIRIKVEGKLREKLQISLVVCGDIDEWSAGRQKPIANIAVMGGLYRAIVEPLYKTKDQGSVKPSSAGGALPKTKPIQPHQKERAFRRFQAGA
jgi:hypothetical protein